MIIIGSKGMEDFSIGASCEVVKNKFELVILAGQRARDLSVGSQSLIKACGDRVAVIALKEIAGDLIDVQDLKRLIIRRHNINVVDFGYAPETAADNNVQKSDKRFGSDSKDPNDMFFGDDDIKVQN